MPKRKRDSSQDKLDKYRRKIQKLEEKQRRMQYRRLILESSSSDSDNEPACNIADIDPEQDVTGTEPVLDDDVALEPASTADLEGDASLLAPPEESTSETASTSNQVTLPDLDPDILLALGESTENSPKYGEKIHDVLAQRWDPILKKGLPKEIKEKLLKDHLVPENCTLLQAPKLNVEVAAAISETARSRDKRKESDQQQLGVGISIINKAMTLLITSDKKVEAIKILSDGCRILTDLHFQETQSRISVINFGLAKPFLNVVQDNVRDETLYGVKLSDKIKASKVIEKQGLQIKKYIKPQKNTTSESTTVSARPHYQSGHPAPSQGNWLAPSRFQLNRGGRRGQRRQPPTFSRRPPPPPAASAAGLTKTRAPTRQ